jgi:proteasome lid subunit RPN8/RPN11
VTLVVEPQHLAAIRKHGEADYPHEACGLLGGKMEGERTVIRQLVALPNERSDGAPRRCSTARAWRLSASITRIPTTRRSRRRSTASTHGRG